MDALAAIADPIRREILRLIWRDEVAAGVIASSFTMSFSAVSQHLAVMLKAGIVERRRDGKKQLYRAIPAALGPFGPALEAFWAQALGRLATLAEAEERGGRPPVQPEEQAWPVTRSN